ncbi:hypothetical protein FQA39_LY05549 [Lamprigera yunnana]|nr:hypothetical protein FQA39_LY05549 [Lamprigera yunnana]
MRQNNCLFRNNAATGLLTYTLVVCIFRIILNKSIPSDILEYMLQNDATKIIPTTGKITAFDNFAERKVLEKLDHEITAFRDNLKKSIQRRQDGDIVKHKLSEFHKYKEHFNNIKAEVANKIQNKEIKSDQLAVINNLLKCVLLKLNEIDTIIQKRQQNLVATVDIEKPPPLNLESSSAQHSENTFDHIRETKMSENFEFKTAASLLLLHRFS